MSWGLHGGSPALTLHVDTGRLRWHLKISLMERVLAGLHWATCPIYLDDILIFSATVQQHFARLREIFDRLKQAGSKIKLNLKQFLGLASYYRRFVQNFAAIVAPLLKERLVTSPILGYPVFNQPFMVDTDASGEGLGAVLSQYISVSIEQVPREGVEYLKKRFQLVHQYVRQKGMQRQKTGYDQKEVSKSLSTMARIVSNISKKKKGEVTYDIRRLAHPRKILIVHYNRLKPFLLASPHGEQESSEEEEEEEIATPSEEQKSRREEEINKEPQDSMADSQDEQYRYVEIRRPEPGPAVEEHVTPPPLIAPAPL
eukprot:Em0001g2957a